MTEPPKKTVLPADLAGAFVWSAPSSTYTAHSPNLGTAGGSSDWFNDVTVESTEIMEELKS